MMAWSPELTTLPLFAVREGWGTRLLFSGDRKRQAFNPAKFRLLRNIAICDTFIAIGDMT